VGERGFAEFSGGEELERRENLIAQQNPKK
jgi:hypothetical protein